LERYFEYYFPDRQQYTAWIWKRFYFDNTTADINNQHTDSITELQESEIQKHNFSTTNRHVLVPYAVEGYPRITKFTLEVFSSFVTAYPSERGFSMLVDIKT